jgi:23S rRNA (adenine2503-C2)-methyltransferase
VKCTICDAGGGYLGKLTAPELLEQLDWLVKDAFPDGRVTVPELAVELTRMGEPTFNDAVLDVLEALPGRFGDARVRPLVSTVGPAGVEAWLERLLEVKARRYAPGDLLLQLSLHTTDEVERVKIVPIKRLSFAFLAAYGRRFVGKGDAKVLLSFPATQQLPLDPRVLKATFSPDVFAVKLTALNASTVAAQKGFTGVVHGEEEPPIAAKLRAEGYDVTVGDGGELDDPTGCGRYFSRELAPKIPRRTHVRD